MKKNTSILLILAMILSLTLSLLSCDETPESENDTNNDTAPGQITEEQWNNAKAEAKFDNVRCDLNVKFISGYNPGEEVTECFQIDGDLVASADEVYDDEEMVASVKSVYIGVVTSVLDNYSLFTFDSEKEQYISEGPIVYYVHVDGIDAKITAENIVVKVNASLDIASLSCRMTQEFNDGGKDKTYVLDVEFVFSNYGTTSLTKGE